MANTKWSAKGCERSYVKEGKGKERMELGIGGVD
jgi:hypothetical protein